MQNQLLKIIHTLDRVPLTAYERSELQQIVKNASETIAKLNEKCELLQKKIDEPKA